MFKRSTVILVVLALALIVGSWAVDTIQSRRQEQAEADSRVLSLDIDAVQGILIERQDPPRIALATLPDNGGLDPDWQITEPVTTRADDFTVRALLRAAADLQLTQEIEGLEDPNLADFGLDPAVETLTLTLADGSQQVLKLGDLDFDETGVYTLLEEGRLVTVPSAERVNLAPNLFALRDKTLLSLPRNRLETLEIAQGEETLEVNFDNNRWRILSPSNLPADESFLNRIATLLANLQAAEIVAESVDEADVQELGLEDPAATLTVTLRPDTAEDEPEVVTLTFGSTTPSGHHILTVTGSPLVAAVLDTTYQTLLPGLEDLRSKAVTDLSLSTLESLQIESPGDPSLSRLFLPSTEVAGQWDVSDQPGRRVMLSSFWQALQDLQATAFLPEGNSLARRALEDPRLILTLEASDEEDPVVLTFGVAGTSSAYVSTPLQPDVLQVERAAYDELESLLVSFRPPTGSTSGDDDSLSIDQPIDQPVDQEDPQVDDQPNDQTLDPNPSDETPE